MPKILVTGGAGYIGSHTLVELYNVGYECVVYDNLSNSSKIALQRVEKLVGTTIPFIKGDIRDKDTMQKVFDEYSIDAVIHFAGLKAVGESVEKPIEYYDNNVNGTLVLLDVMQNNNCKKIVFSSSATVYGDPQTTPIKENFPVGGTTNPYGTSKYMIERILEDLQISDSEFKIAILRYFNPVGAHSSGTIGEDPNEVPNNLMPFISQVAVKKREYLSVFGRDYDTVDGTGVRDYIHVVDLALGHVKALPYLSNPTANPLKVNLGTGNGFSVLQLVEAFKKANNIEIPYKIAPRRAGDIAICYASTEFAKKTLNWEAKLSIEDMCRDTWNWQSNNPNGYQGENK